VKQIEIDTTKIARMLCKAMRRPASLWELALPEAYDLLYRQPEKAMALVAEFDATAGKKKKRGKKAKAK
jgi:hypothetical protein